MGLISSARLHALYVAERKSAKEIAQKLHCSEGAVRYWLHKYEIPRRTISEAIYQRHNPAGDPFRINKPSTADSQFLFGLGLGLYWGEGTKSNKFAVRLGNTDPALVRAFMAFLVQSFSIKKSDLRFGLQLFTDIDVKSATQYWRHALGVSDSQFYKVVVSPSQSTGTYKRKAQYGVITLYFNNKKLRDVLCEKIDELRTLY